MFCPFSLHAPHKLFLLLLFTRRLNRRVKILILIKTLPWFVQNILFVLLSRQWLKRLKSLIRWLVPHVPYVSEFLQFFLNVRFVHFWKHLLSQVLYLLYFLWLFNVNEILHDAVLCTPEWVVTEPFQQVLLLDYACFAREFLFLFLFFLKFFLLNFGKEGTVQFVTSIHHFPEDGALMKINFLFLEFVLDLFGYIHPQWCSQDWWVILIVKRVENGRQSELGGTERC